MWFCFFDFKGQRDKGSFGQSLRNNEKYATAINPYTGDKIEYNSRSILAFYNKALNDLMDNIKSKYSIGDIFDSEKKKKFDDF